MSSGWVRASHAFPDRAANLLITGRRLRQEGIDLSGLEGKPEQLEAALLALVEKYRPELANCTVLAMVYKAPWMGWSVVVTHPSLPPVQFGAEAPYTPLIPDPQTA